MMLATQTNTSSFISAQVSGSSLGFNAVYLFNAATGPVSRNQPATSFVATDQIIWTLQQATDLAGVPRFLEQFWFNHS